MGQSYNWTNLLTNSAIGGVAGGASGIGALGKGLASATPWGAIASGVGSLLGLGKTIYGIGQAAKGNRDFNKLMAGRPQANISQGYLDAFKTYQSLANSEMPGYDIMKGQIDQSGARAMTNLERGAMGSNQLMSGVLSSQDKELEAIKNLGIMSAQWRAEQKKGLAGAQQMMGGQQDELWDYNVNQPWQLKVNKAASQAQGGPVNLFAGLGDMSSSLSNFAGTKALQDMYKSLNPNNNG